MSNCVEFKEVGFMLNYNEEIQVINSSQSQKLDYTCGRNFVKGDFTQMLANCSKPATPQGFTEPV